MTMELQQALELAVGDRLVWTPPGRRYSKRCKVLAATDQRGHISVELSDGRQRTVNARNCRKAE